MAERGTYRAVKVVLLDGPDYQRLPPRARHVFLVLKMTLGPSGIEVHYPEALAHELAGKTGEAVDAVKEALDTLESEGWIEREANVLWIVGQLENDPHMKWHDEKHRTSIWRHLQGLPRLSIVGRYIEAHPDWVEPRTIEVTRRGETEDKALEGAPEDLLALASDPPRSREGQGRASRGPSEGLTRPIEAPNTEDRIPKTDNRSNSLGASNGDAPTLRERFPSKPKKVGGQYIYPPEFEAAWKEYPERRGSNPKMGAYKAWRARIVDGDDPSDLVKATAHYRQHCGSEEKEGTPYVLQAATFFGPQEAWRDFVEGPPATNGNASHWAAKL